MMHAVFYIFRTIRKVMRVSNSYRYGLLSSFFMLILLELSFLPANAATPASPPTKSPAKVWVDDPFASKTESWLSLGGYSQKQVEDIKATEVAARKLQQEVLEAEMLAARVRAMDAPAMPSMRVEEATPTVELVETNVFSQRSEREWMKVEDAAHELSLIRNAKNLQQQFDESPFDIRFASLPDTRVKVSTARKVKTSRIQREKKLAAERAKRLLAEAPKKKIKTTEVEACKAAATYKRRQLAAMESDRRTLSALRNALSDLGLTKKLGFMHKSNGAPMTVGSLQENQENISKATP